jgi:broad specificity phosphatase PhoE
VNDAVLVRHGETEWSATGRHTGRTDIPLNETGRRQAQLLAPRLVGRDFALVLCSPLSRAVETHAIASPTTSVVLDPDLLEWDYGNYEGLTSEEIQRERPGWSLWTDGCPGGESARDVAARADRIVGRCRSEAGEVALFAHGHVLRVLASRWVDADATLGARLGLGTASLSILGREHDTRVIGRWNDTAHLDPRA